VYIYIFVCVWRFVLTNVLASQLDPPKLKFMATLVVLVSKIFFFPKKRE